MPDYQVDDIPAVLKPLLLLFGYGVGILIYFCLVITRLTMKVEITGLEKIDERSNYIFCLWHGSVPLALQSSAPRLLSFLRYHPHVWMQHAAWHMKAIHVLIRLIGVEKIILGSTGHTGREAAARLVECLKSGYSTVILPDGPSGPSCILKKGIVHISLQSGVPVMPIQFEASRFFVLGTWDSKKISYPFSTIRVKIGGPIKVTDDNFEKTVLEITNRLG